MSFFSHFKESLIQVKELFFGSSKNNKRKQDLQQDQILNNYANRRFSPMELDLDSYNWNAKPKVKDNHILPSNIKQHSDIPVYTGNPFNPYF